MKSFAYAQRENTNLFLYQYRDNQHADAGTCAGVMMNRLDFDLKILEIPPVGEDEVANLLGYRLRSVYPGDPENTRFDYRIVTRGKQRYAVLFITPKENMLRYRELAGSKPLLLPYTIVENHLKSQKEGNVIYLFWDHSWLDILVFEEGIIKSSTAVRREKEVFLDVIKLKNILPKNYQSFKTYILGLEKEGHEIMDKTRELYRENDSREYLPVDTLLANYVTAGDSLFKKKSQFSLFISKVRFDILFLPILLLACLLFNSYVEQRVAYKKLLEKTHRDKLQKSQTQQNYLTLQKELAGLRGKRPPDTYLLLSELAKEMGGDAIVSKFRMSEDFSFSLEAEALKADVYYRPLSENKLFKNIQITEIVPDPVAKKDKFKLSGVFNANQ